MTPWGWWAGCDGDHYPVGPFSSREEAIVTALDSPGSYCKEHAPCAEHPNEWWLSLYVIEARQYDAADVAVFGEDILESLEDRELDGWGQDGESIFEGVTRSQASWLGYRLTQVVREWLRDADIHSYSFAKTQNEERLVFPYPESAR